MAFLLIGVSISISSFEKLREHELEMKSSLKASARGSTTFVRLFKY